MLSRSAVLLLFLHFALSFGVFAQSTVQPISKVETPNQNDTNHFLFAGALVGLFVSCFTSRIYFDLKKKEAECARLKGKLQLKTEELQLSNSNLLTSKDALNRTLAELERFTYIASHDLKSPLRNIISFLTLIERKLKNNRDQNLKEYLSYVTNNAQQMHMLIQDVLEFSRVKNGHLQTSTVNMNEMIVVALKNLQDEMEAKDAEVFSADLPHIHANSVQVTQLLQNLVGNGIKYNRSRKPKVVITHRTDRSSHVFSVKDNGIGIAPEYHDKVFEMFKRLHSKEDYPGSGIGLAMCQKIVNNLGGNIWMDSKDGKGTTVHFSIPKV